MSEQPIFIVGCPRSGTALLRDLLRSHPRITFPRESGGELPKLYRIHGDPRSPRQARLLARDLLGSHPVRLWEVELEPEDLAHCRSFAGLVASVYEHWARTEGKPRWGEKTPQHVLELPLLARLFPTAQFIHVIRDGRDVALSLAQKSWGPANPYKAALYWRRCVEAGLADGRPLGYGRYDQVSYEQLITAPERTLRRVCEFLEEEFDSSMLRPSRIPPPKGVQPYWREPFEHEVESGNASRWKREMPDADQAVFEAAAGDLLQRLGYEITGRTRPLGRLERFRWQVHDLANVARWRATASDRVPRAQTAVLHGRSRVLKRLGLTGAGARGGDT